MFIRSFFQKSGYIILTCAILMGQLVALGFIPAQAADYAQAEAPPESQPPEQEVDLSREAADFAWQTETIDANPGAGVFASLALDGSDQPHVSYSIASASGYNLRYAIFDGSVWNIVKADKDSENVGPFNALALDDNNRPHISYYDVDNTALKYSRYDGSTWAVVEVDNSGVVGGFTDIAFNPADRKVHVSYTDLFNQTLKYAYKEGPDWTAEVVEGTVNVGVGTSLILSRGNPRISYHNATDDTLRLATLQSSGTWTNADINGDALGGEFSGFAIASDGYEHISYAKNRHHVRYSYRDAGGWHDEEVATATDDVISTALALDSSNTPAIIFAGQNGLRIAFIGEHGWMVEDIFDGPIYENSIDFAVDSQNTPHIIYANGSGLHHAWFGPTPDLRIKDIWEMDGKFYAQVQNTGWGRAPAGHEIEVTMLYESPPGTVRAAIPVSLAPRERYNVEVGPRQACTGTSDLVRATADIGDRVIESDESNNVREELWKCDTIPPQILTGPEVTSLGTDAVTIAWTTDEDSDSKVYYLSTGGDAFEEAYDATLTTTHTVTLTGLTPATTYSYKVESTDASGNTTTSGKHFFETQAEPVDPPDATFIIRKIEGTDAYEFTLEVADQDRQLTLYSDVESVEFYLGSNQIGQSFSGIHKHETTSQYSFTWSPDNLNLNREEFLKPWKAKALLRTKTGEVYMYEEDLNPEWEKRPVSVNILEPTPYQVFYTDESAALPGGTMLTITAQAHEFEWACEWIQHEGSAITVYTPSCDSVVQAVGRVDFYVDGFNVGHIIPDPGVYDFTYEVDISGFTDAPYAVEVKATASDDFMNYVTSSTYIDVIYIKPAPVMPAPLSVVREVTRNGSHFDVELTIHLASYATGPAQIKAVTDFADEMMPVTEEKAAYSINVGVYPTDPVNHPRTAKVKITSNEPGGMWLFPGGQLTLSYKAVRILYEDGWAFPGFGQNKSVFIFHHYQGQDDYAYRNKPWVNYAMFDEALKDSNYIITTNPSRINDQYGIKQAVSDLYGSMARLATVRSGVLGFLDTYDTSTLDNLVEPGYYWNDALHPAFKQNNQAYLLIVGEENIVPAFTTTDYYVGPSLWWVDVNYHDQWYASTSSPGGTPEINMGRIIGNSPQLMSIPIWTSIAVAEGWDGYNFGTPQTLPPSQAKSLILVDRSEDRFTQSGHEIRNKLTNKGWYNNLSSSSSSENPEVWFRDKISDGWHLVVFRGHGNFNLWQAWDKKYYVTDDTQNINLNGYTPIVLALTCTSGDYVNAVSIAEKFLEWGAGVYIGSLEKSMGYENDISGRMIWDFWNLAANEPIGVGYSKYERAKYVSYYLFHETEKHWVVEYQLYGDPKFGAPATTGMSSAAAESTLRSIPETTQNILVPDFEVTTDEDGFDNVLIPGGHTLTEVGFPLVPYWTEVIEYPAGLRVKDVTLTHRSGMLLDMGLNLPIAEPLEDSFIRRGFSQDQIRSVDDDDWFLELDHVYQWDVIESPDGSSQLIIHIFPFHYQPLTTNYEWYNAFTFDIEVVETGARIEHLTLDKGAYAPGEQLSADLWLNNTDSAADILIVPSVRSTGSEAITDGIMLDTLNGAEGVGHYILEWDSSGFAPGYYALNVELRDAEGNLLHVVEQIFEILGAVGEITHLSALPEVFTPGDLVDIDLTVTNTGYLPLSGEVTIEVQTSDGSATLATFTHPVTDLAPAASLDFNDIWDSTGATEAEYRIIGYMRYETRYSNIATVVVTNASSDPENKIYLPLIVR